MLLTMAAHGFSWVQLLNWEYIKPFLTPTAPWFLAAGAVLQAFLASRRSLPAPTKDQTRAALRRRERWEDAVDLFGWGLVIVGAVMSGVATLP